TTIYDDLEGTGAAMYQGNLADRLLPADKKLRFQVLDGAALGHLIDDEIARLGRTPPDGASVMHRAHQAALDTRDRFGEAERVQVGIGCEACHGGARQHAEDPRIKPSFQPRSPTLRVSLPSAGAQAGDQRAGDERAQWINRTCLRCHTVLFSEYP